MAGSSGTRWWSRRAVSIHLTAAVVVPACLALGWWQLTRALGGNQLSWAYTFEWPIFAGYGLFMWWRLLHEQPAAPRQASGVSRRPAAPARGGEPANAAPHDNRGERPVGPAERGDEEEDEELASYNRYLAELAARGDRKRW